MPGAEVQTEPFFAPESQQPETGGEVPAARAEGETASPEALQDLPALDDDDAQEPIPDIPLDDTTLAEPLAPLETYDLQELAEPAEDAAATPEAIRYYLALEGLEQVGLRSDFLDVSALEEGDGEAANAAMLRARGDADAELAVRLLRSQGYYDAEASAEIVLPAEADGRYRVQLAVTPGEQYTISEIDIVGEDDPIPPELIEDEFALEVGDPLVAERVIAAEAELSLLFPYSGYPFAELQPRAVLLEGDTKTADYVLPIDLGPRARFGDIVTEGDLAFDAEHVEVLARFDEGELYDLRMEDDLREAMIATGLFSSVSIEPVQTGDLNEDGTMDVDLLVRQQAGPPRSITAETGYSTGEGFRVETSWVHRNLFPPEGALEARVVAGTREQAAGLTFRRSNAGARDRAVLLGLTAGRRDFKAYNAYSLALAGRVTRESTPLWQKRWTYAYGAEFIISSEEQGGDPPIFDFDDAFYIAALPGQIGYDGTEDLLDPRRGFRATVRLSPEVSLQDGGFDPYLVSRADVSGYFPLGDQFTLAARAGVASIAGADLNDIAFSRRLYGGGGGSVRGYGFQEIGPRRTEIIPPDPDDPESEARTRFIPTGGRSLNEAAIEGRYRFGNFGVVAFVDAGQVYTGSTPEFSDWQYGAGIGGRYYTNFGPFRADIAFPLNPREGQSDFAVYVSIGQAF